MPLNGRNPFALGLLSGNTTPMFGMGSNLPFIAGGGRFSANEVTLDGIDNNTVSNAGAIGRNGIAVVPSVDAVQEFKVKTSNFSAEFGHAAGAVINATIKSGTNQFHGTSVRVSAQQRSGRQQLLHQCGRTTQTALPSESVRRRGRRTDRPQQDFLLCRLSGHPPSHIGGSSHPRRAAGRPSQRDFSKAGATIYDPNTRRIGPTGLVIATPFPGNVIPQDRLNPTAVAIAKLVPLPNFGAPGALARNFFYQPRAFSNTDQGDIRIDQTLSAKNNLYGALLDHAEFAAGRRQFPGVHRRRHFVASTTPASRALRHPHLYSVAGQRIPLRLYPPQRQYFRDRAGRRRLRAAKQPGTLPGAAPRVSRDCVQLFGPAFRHRGVHRLGRRRSKSEYREPISMGRQSELDPWLSRREIRRRHPPPRFDTLKGTPFFGQEIFGATFTSSSERAWLRPAVRRFSATDTRASSKGTPMIDWGRQRSIYGGGFRAGRLEGQRSLTLNLGCAMSSSRSRWTRAISAASSTSRTGNTLCPGKDGYTRAIVDGDHNNFGPRLGFAWQGTRKFVLRGGSGLFYGERDQNQQVTQFSGNLPNVPMVSLPSVSATQTVAPPFTINTPITVVPTDPSLASFTAAKPFVGTIRSQGFHDARDPDAVPVQSRHSVRGAPVRCCSRHRTAARSATIFRACSSM